MGIRPFLDDVIRHFTGFAQFLFFAFSVVCSRIHDYIFKAIHFGPEFDGGEIEELIEDGQEN